MALVLKDRVKVLATTTGTGTFTLGSAVSGFQDFSVIGNGNTTYYVIAAQATPDWEVGIGTYTASGTTLSRDTILESSNGGSAVNFPAGTKDVFVTYPAERSVYLDSAGAYPVQNTFNTLNAANAVLTAGTISATPTSSTDIVNKTYVDALVSSGVHFHTPVRVESPNTAGNLNATYNNGTSGVGATLTNAGTQAALVIDGVTLSVNDRVLIYNQTNATQNGVYTVTNTGSVSTNWVLTRSTDTDSYGFDSPNALSEGSTFFVTSGSTGAGETYTCNTSGVITFGTTNITFVQISSAQIYSAGTGLTLSGTTFSITNAGTAGTYGSASQVPVIVTNAQGQVTSATNTAIAIAAGAVSGLAASATTDTTNATNITSGTLPTGRLSGSYTGITGVGTLAAGTWNGNTIAAAYGGTGYASYAIGDILYASTTTALSKLADVAVGNALISGGVGAAPSWGKVGLATHVSGTLPIANGGTNATATPTAGGVSYGTGTEYAFSAAGISGQVLTSNGTSAPSWSSLAANVSSISFGTTGLTPATATTGAVTVAGTLAIANGGTGATTNTNARTNLGASTLGSNLFTIANPSAVTFPRFNADNTVSSLDAATFRTAIGAGTSSTTGTVTSVAMTVPTGLTVSGTPITSSGTLALTLTAGYSIPTTASQTNWDAAYTQRLQWDGGATNLVAATGRTSLGATTVGGNFFTLTNPTAITFPRINADNTVSALDAATFRTAIGAGSGTVTGVTATAPVASSGGTAPAISLNAAYGDTLNPYASKTANFVLAAPTGVAGVPTFRAIVAADIPTLNQNTTGNAATATTLQTARTINGVSFNGSANITVEDATKVPLAGGTMTGNLSVPFLSVTAASGVEGGEISLAKPVSGTIFTGNATLDVYTDSVRFFAGTSGGTKVFDLDFTQASGKFVTSTNYNNYAPTLTGTGASGTWGISITGASASATNATNTGITNDAATAVAVYPTWVTANTGNLPQKTTSAALSFVPSTGTLSATAFSGSGASLTALNASNLSTGTVPGDRGVTAGSATSSFVEYNGTTATAGQFDGGTTTPTGTIRLNYGGYFYPTFINLIGSADTATAASHYFVENGSDGFVRPKTLANVQTEIVTTTAVNAAAATTVGTIGTGTWQATDIGLAHGGTNATLTAVNGGVVYSNASAMAITAAGTSGQVLTSNGAAAPTWQAAPNKTTTGLWENAATISSNYSITAGNNAVSAGPVTIASGVVVTVPSGSTWVVV